MSTLETVLESQLVSWAKLQGGVALKGATQFDTGYPDRILYIPGAHAHAEIKGTSSSYHLNDKQKIWAGRIIAAKAPYYIIESAKQLDKFKVDVYSGKSYLLANIYSLNGDQLFLHVNDSTATYDVTSVKDGMDRMIMSGLMSSSLADTIYHIFTALEARYPKTNYEDI